MSEPFRGASGSGAVTVYTVPGDHQLRLEMLTFTLTTGGASGIHSAKVEFYDPSLAATTARIWDWNEGGAGMTLYYTFAIGLSAFNCTVTSGMMIPNRLPDTILQPNTTVIVTAVDGANTTIAGDAIGAVVGYGTFIDTTVDEDGGTVDIDGSFLPAGAIG